MNPNDPLNQKPNPYGWSPPAPAHPQPARSVIAQPGIVPAWDLTPKPIAVPETLTVPEESEDFDAVAPIVETTQESFGSEQFIMTPEPSFSSVETVVPKPVPKPMPIPQPVPIKLIPIKPTEPPPIPSPKLTIPVYSMPSTPEPVPRPIAPQPIVVKQPTPISVQTPEPTFVAKPIPTRSPGAIAQQSGMFSEKKRSKSKKMPIIATVFSLLVLIASGGGAYYYLNLKQKAVPVAAETQLQNTPTEVAVVKGTNTATTLEEATKNIQVIGDKMLQQIRSNTFDGAYALTSTKFQSVTSSTQANDVFKALQPSIQHKDLTFQKAVCYPGVDGETSTLSNESLCGGIYGFKDNTAHKKDYYIVVITDYEFSSIHSIRGYEVSAYTDATVQDAFLALLKQVKQQVDG